MAPTVKRVHQIALRADDLDRAMEFYRDALGLSFIARFDPPGLVFFDLGNTRLVLEKGAPPSLLYLEVDDIDAASESFAAAGVETLEGPRRIHRDDEGQFGPAGNEEWMLFFRDTEQNLLALVERRIPS